MFKATVYVTIKENVLDPQGSATQGGLHKMGYTEIGHVRIGKYMQFEIDSASRAEAEVRVKELCEKILANTVIEDYRFELEEA